MKASAYTLSIKIAGTRCSVVGRANCGSTVGFMLLQRFSVDLLLSRTRNWIVSVPDFLPFYSLHNNIKTTFNCLE